MFEDCNGASLDDVVGQTFVVADTREGMVTIAVMDCVVPTRRALVGCVDWEAEFLTKC